MTNLQKEKKEIAKQFYDKAFKLYSEWNSGLSSLPKPTKPASLQNVDLEEKKMSQLPLDEITKSVLCGTIMCDTSISIQKGYANARFQVRHSTRQFTWFMWKYFVVLKEFTTLNGLNYQKPDGFQLKSPLREGEEILGKLHINSIAHPTLTELHSIICVKNQKTISRFWLNHMNNYFLMTVWLDDGSLYNGRQGLICLNSSPYDQQLIFREYLLKVWGIETTKQSTGKFLKNGQENVRIAIKNQESLLKLLRLIAPVIPVREMLYKVCFVPDNNPSLLQRWKTELQGLVKPEFAQDIEKYYANIESLKQQQNE